MDCEEKLTKIRCGEPRIISLQYKNNPKDELKRKVQYDLIENKPTLIITQEFKMRDSNVQYIVNLNTNLCNHKVKKHKKRHSKSKRETLAKKTKKREISEKMKKREIAEETKKREIAAIATKERIVPLCMRQKCSHDIRAKTQEIRLKRCRPHKGFQSTSPKSKKAVKQNRKETPRKPTHKKRHHEINRHKNRILLSPISSSPLPDEKLHDMSYEDVSDDNFQSNSEDELDTLIKRTKERERNMVIQHIKYKAFKPIKSPINESIENEYFEVSAPNQCSDEIIDNEDNDTVLSCEMNVSIHSMATVVLKALSDAEAYSPTASPFDFEYSNERFQETINFHDTEEIFCETINLEETNPKRVKVEKYSPAIRCSEDREDNIMDDVRFTQEIQKPIKKELDIDEDNDQCYDIREKIQGNLRSENLNPSINTSHLQQQNITNVAHPVFIKQKEIKDDYTNDCSDNTMKCSSSSTGDSNVDTFGDSFPVKQEIKLEPQ